MILDSASNKAKDLFLPLRDKIAQLDGVEERPRKYYIVYWTRKNFVSFEFQKDKLKIHINIPKSELDDPKSVSRNVKELGHSGTGETELILDKAEDINYFFNLIEQSYGRSK